MTPAERFAAWTAELRLSAIPSEVVAAAELHLLDALGCGLAAHAADRLEHFVLALEDQRDAREVFAELRRTGSPLALSG